MNLSAHLNLKCISFLSILLALLVGVLAFPTSVAAKCPDVPSDLVCAELQYSFLTAPIAGEEVTVTAFWVEQSTEKPITNIQWLARKGKPAYLWLWDHEPSELEIIAYVEGMEGKTELPQLVVPLQWDAEKREYQGTFVPPKSGRWYFRLGTLVPDALSPTMEADFDYGGPIQPIDIPAATGSLFDNVIGPIWPTLTLMLGSGLAIFVLRWLRRLPQWYRRNHSAS